MYEELGKFIKKKVDRKVNKQKKIILGLSTYDMEIANFIKKIKSGKSYIKDLKSKEKNLKEKIKKLNTISNDINVCEIKSKYKHFPAGKRYTEFTGINSTFFINIK